MTIPTSYPLNVNRSLKCLICAGLALLCGGALAQTGEMRASMALQCVLRERAPLLLRYDCRTANDAFAGRVTIYARKPFSAVPVARLPEAEEAVWVFDHRRDNQPELILNLSTNGGEAVAELYDRNANLNLLSANCCDEAVDEAVFGSARPTIRVRAPDGWWVDGADGRAVNYNLDLSIDGQVYTIFGGSEKLVGYLATDGVTDYTVSVRDPDTDGRPDYEFRRVRLAADLAQTIRRSRAFERTAIMVNAKDNEPPLRPWLPWPHVGPVTYGYLTNSYMPSSLPAIQLNWETGLIETVGEFVRSRGNDNQWFTYAFAELVPGQANVLDFEAPFAFYRIGEGQANTPDLAVRVTHVLPFSSYLYAGGYSEPITGVRYTWSQFNGSRWHHYKLGLLGHHAPTETLSFKEFELKTYAPYETLPQWLTDQTWGGITFVADMNGRVEPQGVGEGVNEWDVDALSARAFYNYFAGTERSRAKAIRGTVDIDRGYRGEYLLAPNQPVSLYLSPIDQQLHLRDAEGGLWNMGGGQHMRYRDRNRDGYVDMWSLLEVPPQEGRPAVVKQRLFSTGKYLIYANDEAVTIKRTSISPYLFQTAPPTDERGWQVLRRRLETQVRESFAGDLAALQTSFVGPTLRLSGATLGTFRALRGSSFSFVLDVPRAEPADPAALPAVRAGRQLYRYDGSRDAWTVEPVKVAMLSARLDTGSALAAFEPATLRLRLTNPGNVRMAGRAQLRIGSETVRVWSPLQLPGGASSAETTVVWSPTAVGALKAVFIFDGRPIPLGTVRVADAPPLDLWQALSLSTGGTPLLVVAVLITLVILVLFGTWRVLWNM